MPTSLYETAWIFLIYAFLGWCTEVAYAALEVKKFVNRGFLNGPVCPIYGCGVLVVIAALTPLKKSFILLFAGSVILTSAIEFVTGFLLEKLFHNQWWDYSDENFNICGYVCLKFSILWGIGCTLVMDVIHPGVYLFVKDIPKIPGTVILLLLLALFATDLVITVSTILKFNKRLKLMDEAALRIREVSDEIGENIYEGVTAAVEKREELKETIELRAAELTEGREELAEKRKRLQQELEALMEHESAGMKRLMKAFPDMKSRNYPEALKKWKHYVNRKKKDFESK